MDKLKQLEDIAKILDRETVTQEEFVSMMGVLVDFVGQIKETNDSVQEEMNSAVTNCLQRFNEIQGRVSTLKDGEDYVLTPQDKREIAGMINVPVVEKLIQHTETIREQPIITQVALKDTPDETVDKVNASNKKIQKDRVEGLEDLERTVRNNPGNGPYTFPVTTSFFNGLRAKNLTINNSTAVLRGDTVYITVNGGSGSGQVVSVVAGTGISVDSTDPANPIVSSTVTVPPWMPPETPVGAINGSNVTYTLSYIPVNYSGFLYVNGQYYNEGTDWTITSNIITMLTPIDASLSGFPFFFKGQYFDVAPPGPPGSVQIETPAGTVDGSNGTFTVSNAPTYLIIDGFVRFSGFGYTYSSGTITVDPLSPVTIFIRSVYTTSSSFVETPSGTVNGSNLTFTVSNTPVYVIIDGQTYINGFGYTYSAGTITVDALVPPTTYIRSVYSVGTGGVEIPIGALSQNTFTVSNTPKYTIIDNMIWFSTFGYTYLAPTITVDGLVTPQSFIRNIY